MPNEKYLDYAGLQYYHEKLNMDLANMAMTDDNLEVILLDELGIVPPLPETWTESANGILNLALGNSFSYWPEGAGRKSISLAGNTDEQIFWLKLVDGGNFFIDWDSSIEWASGSEPELTAFHEDIFLFYKENSKWIGAIVQSNSITEYWKVTVEVPANTTLDFLLDNFLDTINWGDGSNTEAVTHSNDWSGDRYKFSRHTYNVAGTYQIKVQSNQFYNSCYATEDSDPISGSSDYYHNLHTYITSIDSPLPLIKGTYQWPDDSCTIEDDDFSYMFSTCENLISIPDKLFYHNPNIKWFYKCFENCSSLQSIPGTLFIRNTAPETMHGWSNYGYKFEQCFEGCSSLTSIPSGLFDTNTSITRFRECFYNCTSLTSIPSGLFDNNTAVTSFLGCFEGCSSLQSIPEGLFDNNTAVTSFYNCFDGCHNLGGFVIHIGSSLVSSATNFVTKKSGTTRTVYVPASSTTYTTFNSVASSLGLTIVGV